MWSYVRRHPGLVAAVVWLLLLSPLNQTVKLRPHAAAQLWAGLAAAAFAAAEIPTFAFMRRATMSLPLEKVVPVLFALAVSPVIACVVLLYVGAPIWAAWVAWGVTGVLLGWLAATIAARARVRVESP